MTIDDHPANSQIIQQIHDDFRKTHEIKIESLKNEIKELSEMSVLEKQIDYAEKLRSTGFIQAKGSELLRSLLQERIKALEVKRRILNIIEDYLVRYPKYKFIAEDEVRKLCLKYHLVCGNAFRYKGEIPENNLREIMEFKRIVDKKDIPQGKFIAGSLIDKIYGLTREKVIHFYKDLEGGDFKRMPSWEFSNSCEDGPLPLKICAPVEYMDMEGVRITDNYKIESTNPVYITDPVVLQPVHEGYLVVTAWGNEASDQLVINHILN